MDHAVLQGGHIVENTGRNLYQTRGSSFDPAKVHQNFPVLLGYTKSDVIRKGSKTPTTQLTGWCKICGAKCFGAAVRSRFAGFQRACSQCT